MARLRYLQNKRSGTAGTIVKSTSKLHFFDEGMYIYASADGALEIVSDTSITLTAPTVNVEVTATSVFTDPVTIDFDCTAASVSCLTITSDSESTTGGTNILPLYVDATMSATGGTGRAIEGKLTVSGKLGAWGNAIKGYLDVTGTGCTGLISGICAELRLPSASLQTGAYAVLELEWVGQTLTHTEGSLTGCHTSLIYANVGSDTADDFDARGYIFEIEGLSDSDGNAYYDDTLRIAVGDTAKYIPLSTAQGSFTTSYAITSNCTTDSDSTTTGAIQTDGGLGVLLKSNFGGFMVASQDTGTTDYPTGLNETLTITGNSAGSVAALRALAVMGGTSKSTMNIWGISCAARLKHAADYAGGTMAALLAGVDLHASTTDSCYVYGIQIDFTDIYSNRAASPMAFMCFTDYEATTKPASYLFDFGGMSDRISTGSGKLYYNDTLKIKVHSDDRWIPLSSTQGTLTLGANGSGVSDVIFYGATSGQNLTWDASANRLTMTHSELVNDGGGGNGCAFWLTAVNNLALISNRLCGMRVHVNPKAATDVFSVVGAEFSTYLQADSTVSGGAATGCEIKIQGGTSIASDWYGLYVYSAPGQAPGSSSYVLRLEHNSAVNTNGYITFINGSTCPSYLFDLGPNATETAWAYTGSLTKGAGGWLKVKIGGTETRYIQLYDTL